MKRNDIAKAILYTIAGAGMLMVAITAPNMVKIFSQYQRTKRFNNIQLDNGLGRLQRNKLIYISHESGKTVIKLTKNGKDKLLKYKVDDLIIPKTKHWDKKWRLVVFDIPEKFKSNRDHFVRKLKELGFAQIQRSVWVYPYPCENEIDFLKEIYLVSPFVRIITSESIDIETDLKNKFGF